MAELDRLEVVIQADIDQLRRELKKTERATKTSAGKMKRSLQSLGTSIGALGKRMARLGPLAAVAVAGGLFIATKRALAFADAIGKTSDKIGVHTSFLQEMRFAADQSGIATATLDSNLERFVKRIGEAARGTGEAKKIYEDWGIAIRDANGQIRAADAVLDDVADAMVATTSQTERVAAAAALFGREGVVMVNMLRLGARGMRELREQAKKWCSAFKTQTDRWLKTTVAECTEDGPKITYEEVDTSLIPPRPRTYGLKGAEIIDEVWRDMGRDFGAVGHTVTATPTRR